MSLKPLADSQPQVHVLARGQTLVEAANFVQRVPTNHAKGRSANDILGQQRASEIDFATGRAQAHTTVGIHPLHPAVDKCQTLAGTFEYLQLTFQFCRQPFVIRVEERDIWCRTGLYSGVPRRAAPAGSVVTD